MSNMSLSLINGQTTESGKPPPFRATPCGTEEYTSPIRDADWSTQPRTVFLTPTPCATSYRGFSAQPSPFPDATLVTLSVAKYKYRLCPRLFTAHSLSRFVVVVVVVVVVVAVVVVVVIVLVVVVVVLVVVVVVLVVVVVVVVVVLVDIVVVLTLTRIIKSVGVTGQAPVALELRNPPGIKHIHTKGVTEKFGGYKTEVK